MLTSVIFVFLLSTCMYVVCDDCPFVRLSLFSVPLEIYDLLFLGSKRIRITFHGRLTLWQGYVLAVQSDDPKCHFIVTNACDYPCTAEGLYFSIKLKMSSFHFLLISYCKFDLWEENHICHVLEQLFHWLFVSCDGYKTVLVDDK